MSLADYTDFSYTNQRDYSYIGLMDYNARWYSPSLGRFTQPDSIVPDPGNPQAWNRFSYTSNNPLRYIDPSGHIACEDLGTETCDDSEDGYADTSSWGENTGNGASGLPGTAEPCWKTKSCGKGSDNDSDQASDNRNSDKGGSGYNTDVVFFQVSHNVFVGSGYLFLDSMDEVEFKYSSIAPSGNLEDAVNVLGVVNELLVLGHNTLHTEDPNPLPNVNLTFNYQVEGLNVELTNIMVVNLADTDFKLGGVIKPNGVGKSLPFRSELIQSGSASFVQIGYELPSIGAEIAITFDWGLINGKFNHYQFVLP